MLQVAKQERINKLSISYVYFIYLLYICFFVTYSCCLDSVGGWQQTLVIDIIAIIYFNPLSIFFYLQSMSENIFCNFFFRSFIGCVFFGTLPVKSKVDLFKCSRHHVGFLQQIYVYETRIVLLPYYVEKGINLEEF